MSAALAPGFTDPVFEGQAVFRAVLSALARPGLPATLPVSLAPPPPLTPELAAVALALADPDAPIWLDPLLSESPNVAAFIRFHTGARIVDDPAEAAFALVADPRAWPDFGDLAIGTDEYPDRSTTLFVAVQGFDDGPAIELAGPGIREGVTVAVAPVPADFAERLRRNAALFPRGVDCLLVSSGAVIGIPRSSRVIGERA